ncbi:PREDICTED: very-long-chain (3R)-3-hydroxyacyl-CoA dehydratase 2 [Apaloderma vittatum]|uniref:very-long-chain (3R)-3-hydroxyacyl-CoA dehydratase 2 n=1 Tax=Apaloderma vittatum TaxID=57397 RepID=UPI0005212065|nr:PREDICTED: very-long-chain (3R)-3-hydroxyacyl-CoA dehydratase 2 [Apaloderma vittatum]
MGTAICCAAVLSPSVRVGCCSRLGTPVLFGRGERECGGSRAAGVKKAKPLSLRACEISRTPMASVSTQAWLGLCSCPAWQSGDLGWISLYLCSASYLLIFNFFLSFRWLVIAVGLVRAYLAKGSYHSLYFSIEKPLKFFQTGALLEILHCAFGIVPSSVVLTAFQVMSRVFLTWAVTHSVKEVQTEDSVLLFVVAWTITEIIRYSFYTFSLLNHLPYLIKWARYTLFIVLYPMGVSGELLTIYAALPFVRQSGLYSISLPNKYNFSFDYYTFLILVMISYIPIFPQLYFHMLHQRRKVLSHTEEHKKSE